MKGRYEDRRIGMRCKVRRRNLENIVDGLYGRELVSVGLHSDPRVEPEGKQVVDHLEGGVRGEG